MQYNKFPYTGVLKAENFFPVLARKDGEEDSEI